VKQTSTTLPPLVGGGQGEGSCVQRITRVSTRDFARDLRNNATEAERRLWLRLSNRQVDGLRFRRQVPLGRYIADSFCISAQLVIELDGPSHDSTVQSDARRDAWMQARGIRVLRFANADVLGNLEGVVIAISEFVRTTPPPAALPQGEGESVFAPHPHV